MGSQVTPISFEYARSTVPSSAVQIQLTVAMLPDLRNSPPLGDTTCTEFADGPSGFSTSSPSAKVRSSEVPLTCFTITVMTVLAGTKGLGDRASGPGCTHCSCDAEAKAEKFTPPATYLEKTGTPLIHTCTPSSCNTSKRAAVTALSRVNFLRK